MDYPLPSSSALIVLGAILLSLSLYPTTQIIRELAPGSTRSRWRLMRGFIVLFMTGYVVPPPAPSLASGTPPTSLSP